MIKFSMQFRDNEETRKVEDFAVWLKNIASRLSYIPGVAHVEISQNQPFTFLTDQKIKMHYAFQLDILYHSEKDFNLANEKFGEKMNTDDYLLRELIRVEPFCDIHICYIEKVLNQKKSIRKFFSWDK